MTDRVKAYFDKRRASVKTKECNMCGLFKPLSDYSFDGRKLRPNCKVCNANRYVTCHCGCGRKLLESNMDIYDCATNAYFYSQPHKDKKDGVKRDVNGFIREWL